MKAGAHRIAALLVLLSPALPLGPAGAASAQGLKGDYHEDARFGFKVKPPKEWKGIPVPTGQSWVVGKYLSEKKYFYTEKGSYTYEFQPEMTIVAFVSEELKKAARKQALDEAADDEEAKLKLEMQFELQQESDFRDFKDYLSKTYSEGGFYFSKEEPGAMGDMRTMLYEAKVEKGSSGGPKRIVSRVYSLSDVDVAVQIEILDQDYDKLASVLETTFRSMKAIPREGEMPVFQGQLGNRGFVILENLEEMTPAERKEKRLQEQKDLHAKAIAGLAEGWHHESIDGCLIVSRADDRFDKKVAEQAGAVIQWLDKTFPYVGEGEYVREPVIRICKDYEEEKAFHGGDGPLNLFELGLEVTTNQEYGGTRSFEFGLINGRMAILWFGDRDRKLLLGMPSWLSHGLIHTVVEATPKGDKLEFYRGDWTAEALRTLVGEDRAAQPRDLIYMTSADFSTGDERRDFERDKEAQALVNYLLLGPGSKSAKTKNVIKDYVTNLKAVITEMEAAEEAEEEDAEDDQPKTEAEEEAALKEEKELWKARERQLINEAARRTFSGWDEKDWEDLAKNYFKSI